MSGKVSAQGKGEFLSVLPGFIGSADYAVAVFPFGFAWLRHGLPRRKKIRQKMPDFLKTGGRSRTRIYDLHDVNVTL